MKYSYECCVRITYDVIAVSHTMLLQLFSINFKAVRTCIILRNERHRDVIILPPLRTLFPIDVAFSDLYF